MMSPQRRNSHDSGSGDNNSGQRPSGDVFSVGGYDFTTPRPCVPPKGCGCLRGDGGEEAVLITPEDLKTDAVKIVCSNEACPVSPFLHTSCFANFEDGVLMYLKSHARSRGWSEKQRLQNLWTKRGYDLIYKACECSCGRGYVRKDLDWRPPDECGGDATSMDVGDTIVGSKRKRKKSKGHNKPVLTIGLPAFGGGTISGAGAATASLQPRSNVNNANSTATTTSNQYMQQQRGSVKRSDARNVPRNRTNSVTSNTSSGSSFASCSPPEFSSASPSSADGIQQPPRRALLQGRSRHDSGGSIFQRRLDYSSFNVLPKYKINSYHIKMEDECSIGNDETRIFILSSYASNKMNRVPCVACKASLCIFDRYPLIDGTFFLSPRQHSNSCIRVKMEGKTSYLTAVCMNCLEGWSGGGIVCRFCFQPWTGGHLILGTMYSYDIFAAMPCCPERFKCNTCGQLVCHPEQRFNYFSDYSQIVSCPHCGVQDSHFTKSLAVFTTRDDANKHLQLAQTFQQQLSLQQQGQCQQQQELVGGASNSLGLRVHRVNSA